MSEPYCPQVGGPCLRRGCMAYRPDGSCAVYSPAPPPPAASAVPVPVPAPRPAPRPESPGAWDIQFDVRELPAALAQRLASWPVLCDASGAGLCVGFGAEVHRTLGAAVTTDEKRLYGPETLWLLFVVGEPGRPLRVTVQLLGSHLYAQVAALLTLLLTLAAEADTAGLDDALADARCVRRIGNPMLSVEALAEWRRRHD